MILSRRIPLLVVFQWGARVALVGAVWAVVVFSVHYFLGWSALRIPFLPIATIGTAVAFYVGFKNNAAYERFWEGRKIWGGIVNESRSWAAQVIAHVAPGNEGEAARRDRQTLIYHHLAWVNALRLQLRRTSRFHERPARTTRRRLEAHGDAMRNDWEAELSPFLSAEALGAYSKHANPATHILYEQALHLERIRGQERIDLFHQIALMDIHRALFALQGKCERIKNTPFPRQYAEYSRIFVRVFVFLLPFGLLDVFADLTTPSYWPTLPGAFAAALVTWVFFTMEGIGDASEDPFERSMNDVPMNALCRTIEIDLRSALGETDLPPKEEAVDGILY